MLTAEFVMLGRDRSDGLQSRLTLFRQVQRIAAAVAFMRTSFQQSLGFEIVNNRH